MESEVRGLDDEPSLLDQFATSALTGSFVILDPAAGDVPKGPAPSGVFLAHKNYPIVVVGDHPCES